MEQGEREREREPFTFDTGRHTRARDWHILRRRNTLLLYYYLRESECNVLENPFKGRGGEIVVVKLKKKNLHEVVEF